MNIREHAPLAPYTTFKIGGPARYFCAIHSLADIAPALDFAEKEGLPIFVLGGGSNVLISDHGFPGVVLHMRIPGMEWEEDGDDVLATAGAGVVWDELAEELVERGYWGLENLSGIPGSVGASVIQNIGAYGTEVSRVVEWVKAYDVKTRSVRKFTPRDCVFGYRDSIWKHESGLIVTGVQFRLAKKGSPNITYKDLKEFFANVQNDHPTQGEVRAAVLQIRFGKFPDLAQYGTAGSFFKHPIVSKAEGEKFLKKFPDAPAFDAGKGTTKLSAGWIIDHVLALRGVQEGNVGTWERQALVLVNYGDATANEVIRFSKMIQHRVREATGISFEPEVVQVNIDA